MRAAPLERQVAELVDDEQLWFRVEHQAVAQLAIGFGFGEGGQECGRAREEDGVAGLDDGAAERDREMCLADAWRAKDQNVFGLDEKSAGGKLPHETLVDRWLEFEIEVLERLHRREVRDLEPHGDASPLLGIDFLSQHAVEEIEIRRFGAGRLTQHGVQPLGHIAEPQPRELLDDARLNDHTHWSPPETIAAYSVRSRPRSANVGDDRPSAAGRQSPA